MTAHAHHSTPTAPAAVVLARVTAEPIDMTRLESMVRTAEVGATVSFVGCVRDHDHGRAVRSLEYEAHPSAQQALQAIADEVSSRHPGARLAVLHRTGRLDVGEVALGAVIGTAHRADAFAACAELVEAIKDTLPIWKLQTFDDGSAEWVNCL